MFTETMHKVAKAEIIVNQIEKPIKLLNKLILIFTSILIVFVVNGVFLMKDKDHEIIDK